ncbi:MAG: DNA polymerase III subunit alpha [Alphaproteobacteria bacterium]|nr:DNA polymerase III subunit alpha [Alphaproteobacteria bacterium]
MTDPSFIHLRVHSAYSLSEGAIKLKDLLKLCQEAEMPAVAVTDTANLFGALEFASTFSGAGIQPIIGCQLAVGAARAGMPGGKIPEPDSLLLLVQSEAGYRNLLTLVSKAFLDTDPGLTPHVTWPLLEEHADGLICLTGGPGGPVDRALLKGQRDEAHEVFTRLRALFPNRLYVELQRHGTEGEESVEERLLDLAFDQNIPIVATNECFFPKAQMYEAHDALLCIAGGTYVAEEDRRRETPRHYFRSADEMAELFADLPEAIENTVAIAKRCAYFPKKIAPILPAFPTEGGRSEAAELRAQSEEGLQRRLDAHVFTDDMDEAKRAEIAKPYHDRLDRELGIIEQMGFPGYFLIVADFIQWAKDHGIPVGPGRGSGAGSLVAYALTITDLDPLRWGLLFERFLNPERVSMPDFDVDFCQDRRDEVIKYVQDKYGYDRVAQIITFGKLQARAVLRDVGRVLQLGFNRVDRICKLVPNNPANPVTLQQAVDGEPELQRQRDEDPDIGHLIQTGLQLEGLFRHASTHAAGVVIGDRPLHELIPLYRDPRSDMPVTQFNMKWVESAGLVKFDFLGLKTLSVLATAERLIRKRGIAIDLTSVPLDDAPTYAMLARADSTGVFQLESSGMRDVLRKLKPNRFEDIIALVALYRPGPMDNIPSYIRRKHGEEVPDYLHPKLEPILTETFGIMIYQEQVMQAAQLLSGYSLGGADLLRRAMGKKIKEEMDAQREMFCKGAVENGVDGGTASDIFDQIAKFAGYGFNKSHAAAYALVAYHTAYLKANYPVEFMAASMTYDLNNTDKLNVFKQELDRQRIPLLPPDVNRSEAEFGVEETAVDGEKRLAVRYALAALKNVGEAAMESLCAERRENGRFKDVTDFAHRVDGKALNKRQLENMIRAGAFDSLDRNRGRLFQGAELILKHAGAAAQERDDSQIGLFGGGAAEQPKIRFEERNDWPILERLKEEFDAVGFYLSAHPLDAYGNALERIGVVESAQLERLAAAGPRNIKVAGIVVSKQERTSAKGNRFAFVKFTDRTGVFEVTLFSDTLYANRELLDSGKPLLVNGSAKLENESLKVTVSTIEPLDDAVAHAAAGLKIFVDRPEPIEQLASILKREQDRGGRGRSPIKLALSMENREVEMVIGTRFRISGPLRAALKSVDGILHIQDI